MSSKSPSPMTWAASSSAIVSREKLSLRAWQPNRPLWCFSRPVAPAPFWGRTAHALGHQARLLPAQYTAPYRRRGKTDRTDVEALLEAHRCNDIRPLPVHAVEQQTIHQLHRLREQSKHTRTQRSTACAVSSANSASPSHLAPQSHSSTRVRSSTTRPFPHPSRSSSRACSMSASRSRLTWPLSSAR